MSIKVPYIELLMKMIAIPAISRNEALRSNFLEGFLRDMGFSVKRIFNNLWVGNPKRLDARPRILLNSHLDTVSPVEGWKTDPYGPVMDGDRITGLGSNDAGASVVSLLAAYGEMKERLEGSMDLLLLISA